MQKKPVVKAVYPLTPMQEGMLFHSLYDKDFRAYFEQLSIKVQGNMDLSILQKTFDLLVDRYDILRTIFIHDNLVKPRQVVIQKRYGQITAHDLSQLSMCKREEMLEELKLRDRQRGFDLSKDMLIRISLVKMEEGVYELIWSHHHILIDGWCLGILISDFMQIYLSLVENREPSLNKVYPYSDYLNWLEKQDHRRADAYWQSFLHGYETYVTLPIITGAGRPGGFQVAELVGVVEKSEELTKLARAFRVTINTLCQAIWGVLLMRYNNSSDVIFGSVVAGRPAEIPGVEQMVGLFINTLPVRVKTTSKTTFVELLQTIYKSALAASRYEYYPLAEIQNMTSLKQNLIHHIVVFENYPIQEEVRNLQFEGLPFTIENIEVFEQTNYDFNLRFVPGDELLIKFDYNSFLYEQAHIEQMKRHFNQIVNIVLYDPEIRVEAINIITDPERKILRELGRGPLIEGGTSKTLHQLFEEQVIKTPDEIALILADNLTYAELNGKANQLARQLQTIGVTPGTLVGVLMESSLEMAIGLIAILKAGGAYLPMDVHYPEERINFILEDSGVCLILTNKRQFLKFNQCKVIDLTEDRWYQGSSANLGVTARPEDLAYVIYTSGSTGHPKGVLVKHQSIVNTLIWRKEEYALTTNDRILQLFSVAFDGFVTSFFTPLLSGAKVVLLWEEEAKDPLIVKKQLIAHQVSHFIAVPSLFFNLLPYLDRESLNSLRMVTLAGEKIHHKQLAYHRDKLRGIELINEYGPTENSVVTTFCRNLQEKDQNTIGRPIANTQVYIVNEQMQLQPFGIIGEICISGAGVALGYLNRPHLTKDKFIQCPFQAGEVLYRTGDLGRWLAEGVIEFVGRNDHQVKIRGYRIETGEIEVKLLGQPGIREAVVMERKDEMNQSELWAYLLITSELNKEGLQSRLRNELARELPEFMLPTFFVPLEELPYTPNGKIDRKALLALDRKFGSRTGYVAPKTDLEIQLASIWSEVLRVRKIGLGDNFFELGGHSLKATILTSRVKKELGVHIPIQVVFQRPGLSEMVEYIKQSKKGSYIAIEKVEEADYYPVSSAQKRLYVLHQLEGIGTTYNIPGVYIIEGCIDNERLERVFAGLIERHEALRTSFALVDGEPVQRVHKAVQLTVEYFNLSDLQDKRQITEIVQGFIRPFDLSIAPLCRVGLIQTPNEDLLLLDMHHIISDGVSMNILINDFIRLYAGEKLDALRIQYKDFAIWQNQVAKLEMMHIQEEYWVNQFAGDIPLLDLPTDFCRSAEMSFAGSIMGFKIDDALTNRITNLVRQEGVTLYMVLLAAFNILLAKYSGQEDIIVGTPIAGRSHPDLEQVVGMFVNTLAMRNIPKNTLTFSDFLANVKENALQAYENQDYQFEVMVERLNLERDLSRNPLFDVMFVLQNTERTEIQLAGLKTRPYQIESTIAKMDLTLNVIELDGDIQMSFEYRTTLFAKETIERLANHLVKILKEVVSNPNSILADITILSQEEKELLLEVFNDTKAPFDGHKTIHQLVEEQVIRTPDKIALVHAGRSLTYRELNQRANQLARILKGKGVKPDDIIGLICERSLELIIGMLAILKAGGAYMPIDPESPGKRIEYMLCDSNATLLLADQVSAEWITIEKVAFAKEVLVLSENYLCQGDIAPARSNLENVNSSKHLAYVIYTSGSTGKPKGVMTEHRNLVNMKNVFVRVIGVREDDRVGQFASCSFDMSVLEIYAPLFVGATLYIIEKNVILDYDRYHQFVNDHQLTIIALPPFYLRNLYNREFKTVKTIITGGSAVTLETINPWKDKVRYINIYGPTETTIFSTQWSYKDLTKSNKSIPIGIPVLNTKIYILDNYAHLVPIGVVGELCISGEGVSRGYLNKQNLTAEKFVPNPFEPGQMMYKTGDLARWLADGNIEYIGRKDNQVKIRGFRIELGEIENRLISHNEVKEAVVMKWEEEAESSYLSAYITSQGDISNSELREFLAQELPEYMIPAHFVHLTEMPRTASDKIDRQALRMLGNPTLQKREYIAPIGQVEEVLADIWTEILKVDNVGRTDNFFELGGQSLKATTLVAKIYKELHVELPLREVFKNPILTDLARIIKGKSKLRYAAIPVAPKQEYYPVSSAQKRLYVLHQMEGIGTTYNMPGVYTIKGEVEKEKLVEVLATLVERHEALRTSFAVVEGEPVQKIGTDIKLIVEYFDISGLKATEQSQRDEVRMIEEKQIAEIIQRFIRPFDLSVAPLCRIGLIQAITGQILLIDMHHIISDGVSMNILINDFYRLFAGEKLASLDIQYKDFAIWQNQMLRSEELQKQEEYWLNQFAGEVPVLNLPTDLPRGQMLSFAGNNIGFRIEEDLTNKLKVLAHQEGMTLYMVLLAVYNILLAKYSSQDDIVVGTPTAGRPHPDIDQVVGMFVNTLVMRNTPQNHLTFRELLANTGQNFLYAHENQDYQFEILVEKLNLQRNRSRNPLFDVMFAHQHSGDFLNNQSNLLFIPYQFTTKISKFDITLNSMEDNGQIVCNLEYKTSLFTQETIQRLAEHFINILKEITAIPDVQIAKIQMLSEKEKRYLLLEVNESTATYPKNQTIHQLFAQQVSKTPENVAVVFGKEQLTYRQLNKKVNQLAQHLWNSGVKPQDIVGIMVKPSLEMLVGILGILVAGGAYLPIDPDYPVERINYILDDSKTSLLLITDDIHENIQFSGQVINYSKTVFCKGEFKDIQSLEHINRPNDLAYIIYTSGSTGKPKGVMIEHLNVVRLMINNRFQYDFSDKDVWTMFHSFCFDFSVWEMYGALFYGGKLVVVPRRVAQDTAEFLQLLKTHKVTVLNQTPTAFYNLSHEELKHSNTNLHLRYVIFGGEVLKPMMLKDWKARYPETRLINMYGITETTVHVTFKEITDIEIESNQSNIGKPIPTVTAYIMDKEMQLVPLGVTGELCIGGEGLARGYLNKPELTDEKFVVNPYIAGDRIYRSGDLAKRLFTGEIEYMGRNDNQVKIRGFRIELGEIEKCLLKHPEIKEVVILEKTDVNVQKYLCAYLVLSSTSAEDIVVSELRQFLAKDLPEYMIPSYFIRVERIPMTSNGKVDRLTLLELDRNIQIGEEYSAPTNPIEAKLALLWSEVLGVEKIGIHNNFFDLGGHSLKATQLVSLLHKRENIKLPLEEVFKNPTIAALAKIIVKSELSPYQEIEPLPKQAYYATSYSQRRLWLINAMDPESTAYNMPGLLVFDEVVEPETIKKVLDQLVERHESLRTSFSVCDDDVVQIINERVDFELELCDLSIFSEEEKELKRREGAYQVSHAIFDLKECPLFRTMLVKLKEDQFELYFVMHHIISDGWSFEVLKNDFLFLYEVYKKGDDLDLTTLKIQYKDFAAWQNKLLQDQDYLKMAKEFWLHQLAGELPVLELPADGSRENITSWESGAYRAVLTKETTEKLKEVGKRRSVSLFTILLAALNFYLARITQQNDIIIGTPSASRKDENLSQVIGFFINTIIFRNQVDLADTFSGFVAKVHESTLKALQYQDYPLEIIIDELKISYPSISVFFNLINVGESHLLNLEDLSSYHIPEVLESKFELSFYVTEYANGIEIRCHYLTELFSPTRLEFMVQAYLKILDKIAENPDKPMTEYLEIKKKRSLKLN